MFIGSAKEKAAGKARISAAQDSRAENKESNTVSTLFQHLLNQILNECCRGSSLRSWRYGVVVE